VTTLSFNAVEAVVSTSLALTAVAVITAYPGTAWLLVIPTVGLYLTNHAYARERRRHQGIEFLHDSTRLLHEGRELEAALLQLVDQSRQAYRAGFAQLVYHPADADVALVVVADRDGVRSSSASHVELGLDELADRVELEPLLLQRGDSDGVALAFLDRHDLVDAVVAPLRTEGRRSGLLLIGNVTGEVGRFTRSDTALWQALAVNVAAALENGQLEQSLGRLRQLEQRLVHQATHDALTTLPNRVLLLERLDAALDRGDDVSLLFIDLDDFKEVNDGLGHSAGDALLRAVAERLTAVLPPTALAARHGGDEFAVLLPTADELEASFTAQQVLGVLTAPVSIGGEAVPVRASVGVAVAEPGWGSEDLLRNADVAMYSAKSSGKNRIARFDPALHEEALRRYQLSVELDRAIRTGALIAHYQPIVELASGRIVAAEALVRWPHPARGLLPASDFVPVAMASDAIVSIRRAVFAAVCEQLVALEDGAGPLPIWVNVSTRDLLDPSMVDEVAVELDRRGIDPGRLVVEVTEGLMIADPDAASRALDRIRALGARIALDDFGTGYSSLSTLHRLPVDVLKIAKPFVDDVDRSDASAAFVEAIIRMAQALHLQVVAEGIERPAQAARLEQLGCSLGQGFHFAMPVAADELRRLVAAGRASSAPGARA
jgi:diguanylate cyclase (GGDEF)-like protein